MRTETVRTLQAYLAAVALFALLHFIVTAVANRLAQGSVFERWHWPLIVSGYVPYVTAGFVAGAIARRRPIISGIVAGILSAVVASAGFGVAQGDLFGVSALVGNGLVFGGVGGALSLLLRRTASPRGNARRGW